MEASENQKEDMFTYAQNIVLQVCLIWIITKNVRHPIWQIL